MSNAETELTQKHCLHIGKYKINEITDKDVSEKLHLSPMMTV